MKLRLADVEPSPDVFAAVMATGILSIAAGNHHYRLISETMGVLASLGMVVLAALVMVTRGRTRWDLKDPSVGSSGLAVVAATVARHTPERWWLAVSVPVGWRRCAATA